MATGEEGFLTEACREHGFQVHVVPRLQREIKPLNDLRALGIGASSCAGLNRIWCTRILSKPDFWVGSPPNYSRIPVRLHVHMWPFGDGRSLKLAAGGSGLRTAGGPLVRKNHKGVRIGSARCGAIRLADARKSYRY